ncbi:XkdQ/YqbQ family protein [Heyndrickxia oleronia]|uniref:XkdQ/YqbQ family protein n=1 Tax=Heyndrickxia oleronia TaxID=38875 RepID=UPI003753C219
MIEVFVIQDGKMKELPVVSVTWSGSKDEAARKIEVDYIYTLRGLHGRVKAKEGDGVIFKWKGKELFRGSIFDTSRGKSGPSNFVAYDLLIYSVKNRDSYIFSNKSADAIFKRTCGDFGLPMGKVDSTSVVFKNKVFDGETLWDMWMKSLSETYKRNGRKFTIYADKGLVNLVEKKKQVVSWVVEDGVNLIDFNSTTSISDTITQVKLEAGEDKKTITATVSNNNMSKKFGVMQHYEKVSEKLNKAQLTSRAKSILSEKGKISKTLDITALGLSDLTSGKALYVISKDLEVNRGYFIKKDSHTFKGNDHIVDLSVTETDELPEVG